MLMTNVHCLLYEHLLPFKQPMDAVGDCLVRIGEEYRGICTIFAFVAIFFGLLYSVLFGLALTIHCRDTESVVSRFSSMAWPTLVMMAFIYSSLWDPTPLVELTLLYQFAAIRAAAGAVFYAYFYFHYRSTRNFAPNLSTTRYFAVFLDLDRVELKTVIATNGMRFSYTPVNRMVQCHAHTIAVHLMEVALGSVVVAFFLLPAYDHTLREHPEYLLFGYS